ncbi:MAG: acylphosphatase [Alphaproteobacteria bacterium]|nr:acylphosphatase [Alphaproteobacteria bacterium]
MSDVVTVAFRVTGRVQGVGFRASTQRLARARGLVGWVRNVRDGSVQGRVQGPAAEVEGLFEDLAALPPPARAADVARRAVGDRLGPDFVIAPTVGGGTEDWG